MFDVSKIRADFPILATTVYGKPLVYLDNAATTQKPRCVVEAVREQKLESSYDEDLAESVANLGGSASGGAGTQVVSILTGLVVPVLYIIGAVQLKKQG